MSVLAIRNLSKAFGGVRAVNDVSFAVGRGEFLARPLLWCSTASNGSTSGEGNSRPEAVVPPIARNRPLVNREFCAREGSEYYSRKELEF